MHDHLSSQIAEDCKQIVQLVVAVVQKPVTAISDCRRSHTSPTLSYNGCTASRRQSCMMRVIGQSPVVRLCVRAVMQPRDQSCV